jgi:subtilase family serine protease
MTFGNRRIAKAAIPAIVFAWACAVSAYPGAARRAVDDDDRVVLPGNVSPRIQEGTDLGAPDPGLPLKRIIVLLRRRPGAGLELDRLLRDQQDPASPLFHRWLTPEEFGQRFGPTDPDLNRVIGWFQDRGIAIDEVARGRGWIDVSATAAQIEEVFRPSFREYAVEGVLHRANSVDPSIPSGIADVIGGIASLHDFRKSAHHTPFRSLRGREEIQPYFSNPSGFHYVVPADLAVIYNLKALYDEGIDGTGRTIAIVGRSQIHIEDVRNFRERFGLAPNDPAFILNGEDPGNLGGAEEGEADLDIEWSGGLAPKAAVKFVISKSTDMTDGVDLSAQYVVDHNLGDVMSTSFGACEAEMGADNVQFYNDLWAQAAAQGITSFVSSGDSGPAGCEGGREAVGKSLAVSGLCSTPYDVCVGGTEFVEAGSGNTYWASTSDPATGLSALSFIPEQAWNESGTVPGGSHLWSSAGGASATFSKPDWQSAPGVPADGKRDVPDISLTAAEHDGYLVIQGHTDSQDGLSVTAGTSASSPSMAAIMALVDQKTGARQGNANIRLYELATAQYSQGGAAVFHDTVVGDNNVPHLNGFACGTGYDQVTGLGSVDAKTLADNFGSPLPPEPCVPGGQVLCLNGGRFKVEVEWQATELNPPQSGNGQAVALTGDTGYFWFFSSNNVELIVKVVDGRALNNHFWVFYGALSNVRYTISVTDSQTGAVRSYVNPQGTIASVADTSAFPAGVTPAAGSAIATPDVERIPMRESARMNTMLSASACTGDATTLCLNSGRFQVRVAWAAQNLSPPQNGSGQAEVLTGDTGYFWFFSENNIEIIVKVVDGRPLNGHFWVFYGALSNVQYTISVTDRETGDVKVYTNPQNTLGSVADTSAF